MRNGALLLSGKGLAVQQIVRAPRVVAVHACCPGKHAEVGTEKAGEKGTVRVYLCPSFATGIWTRLCVGGSRKNVSQSFSFPNA